MAELPLAPLKRLMKQSGAERVGEDGARAMRDVIEDEIAELTQEADKFARHADRKTIQAEDVRAASD